VLAGPFKVLAGHLRRIPPTQVHPFLLDRHFYDSPEIWTVAVYLPLSSASSAASHSSAKSAVASSSKRGSYLVYYRDDPRPADGPTKNSSAAVASNEIAAAKKFPFCFVGSMTPQLPIVTLVGPNLLTALLVAADERLDQADAPSSKKSKVAVNQKTLSAADPTAADESPDALTTAMRTQIDELGKQHGYTLTAAKGRRVPAKRDPMWTKRQKAVVCDLDNGVGLVVPFGHFPHH
jgi:hypothetical protein